MVVYLEPRISVVTSRGINRTDAPFMKLLAIPWKRRSEAERCAVFWKSFKNLKKFKVNLSPIKYRAEYAHLCQSSSVMS